MVSPDCSGKSAASTIWSPRRDSPLPVSSSASDLVPTMPPSTVARITNANQPRIAFLRCCADQRPARAAKLRDCILGAPPGERWRPTWGRTERPSDPAPRPCGLAGVLHCGQPYRDGEADRAPSSEHEDDQQDEDDDEGANPDVHVGTLTRSAASALAAGLGPLLAVVAGARLAALHALAVVVRDDVHRVDPGDVEA